MGTLQPPNRYRACILPHGFPQSLSGSETDVSTSNENLSNEEKYVIRHTARQEPQGQENLQSSNRSSLRDSLPSNRSSLDVSSSSYNTLIIHSAGDEPWTGRNSGTTDVNPPSYLSHQSPSLFHDPKLSPVQKRNSASPSPSLTGTGVQEITEIPDDYLSQSSVLKHLAKEVKAPNAIAKENVETMDGKLLSKDSNLKYDYENRPPPPEYSKWEKSSHQSGAHKNKSEKYSLSKSQPDLSKVGLGKMGGDLMAFKKGVTTPRPKTKGREEYESNKDEGDNWPSIDGLMKENTSLKIELKNCYQRVAKTQKFEQEVLKVHKAHEELVQTCDKRERLEKAARVRLQNECKRLQEINRELQSQVNFLSNQILSRTTAPDTSGCDSLRRELNKRELLITQLITQNKELVAAKERQEIELAAQRVTLQEQRNHIDILEAALTNAQRNVVRLEEESHKKQVYVERVIQLQRALSSLQLASDKREQTERNLRLQLEMELQRSKNANCDEHNSAMNSHINLQIDSISELKRRLRDREEKIISLEGECSKWEQRYLEESGLRQAAIDAASIPKDAKIAALEKTSHETEKIITEARNEKIRHMDEVHAAQKKVADLESRLKDLESKLAERDAMIRVLQKHTYDKDVSSMLGRSPHHTPHPSLGGADIDHVLGTTVSREELVSSVLTSSTGFGSNSYAGSDSSYHMPSYSKYESNKSFDSTKQTLDNQLKEIDSQLDSQLLSKRGLCCFPGFTNPVTAQRKGKIPKPLLAGVSAGTGGGLFETGTSFLLPPASRHESGEMLLLEKQGRTSQQQRMQENSGQTPNSDSPSANNPDNLPPSSLPRPPRSSSVHRSGLPRRLGEYNRLADAELPQRKKSDGGDSLSSNASRGSPSRSHIPPPARKLGEYGRLSESGGSSASLRKPSTRMRVGSTGERDSTSTLSDNSASSLPPPSKVKLYGATTRRGSSLGRDSKSSTDSNASKYRIQF